MDAEGDAAVLTRLHGARLRPLTVAEYYRMGEAGIFARDERIELIDGQIVAMSPIGTPHIGTVIVLTRLLTSAIAGRAEVSVQNPVRLDDLTEPEPDFAILKPRPDDYRSGSPPRPEDILLLIEVAETNLAYDRGVKLGRYARHAIPEVWIVNLGAEVVEVYRSPSEGRYEAASAVGRDGTLDVALIPGTAIPVAAIFGNAG
jgi:Uma2 family endonuclease